jgi:hypothetical protein
MKLSITELRSVRQWRAATGLDAKRFHGLLPLFAEAYRRLFGASMAERETINPDGATLTSEEELLFFTLFSFKSGLTYDVLGLVCGLDGANAQRQQDVGIAVLKEALQTGGYAPKRSFQTVAEFHRDFLKRGPLLLDATEQRTQRPQDKQRQKGQYSGKKKPTPSRASSLPTSSGGSAT